MKDMLQRIAVFSVVCGLLITPLDSAQVAVGVENPSDTPWFVTIQFAIVGAVIAILSKKIDPNPKPETLKSLVTDGVLFVGGYLCTLPQARGVWSTTLVYYLFLLSVMAFRAARMRLLRETLLFAALLAVIGSVTEALDVYMGGFSYHPPTVWNLIPIWLPLQYASAAPLVRGLAAETTRTPDMVEVG